MLFRYRESVCERQREREREKGDHNPMQGQGHYRPPQAIILRNLAPLRLIVGIAELTSRTGAN